MMGVIDCKYDVDIDDLDVVRDMGCDDLFLDLLFEFNVFVEVIMIEEDFRMLENVNEVKNFYLIFVNEIEKLLQVYSYWNG